MHQSWLKNIWGILLFAVNAGTTAVLTNLIASKIYEGKSWNEVFGKLGWWNLLMVVWALSAAVIVKRMLSIQQQEAQTLLKFRKLVLQHTPRAVNLAFRLAAEKRLYPDRPGQINIHVFLAGLKNKTEALVKDRRFAIDQEIMSRNYSLDYAFPRSDKLVICEAFKDDALKYRELTEKDVALYGAKLNEKVDPAIRWVLACPIHSPNNKPLGVICAFGSQQAFNGEDDRRRFEQALVTLAELIHDVIVFEREIA